MSVFRIVKRNLQGTGEAKLIKGDNIWRRVWINGVRKYRRFTSKTWIDLRPRDKFGILAGYCSQREKERMTAARRKGMGA